MKKTLGETIRALREQKDISLREFAKRLDNLSAAHLSDIELGRRSPSPELLEKIATKLEIPLEDLQKLDSRPPVEELKRKSAADPAYGFALRKMVEADVKPEDIMQYLEEQKKKEKKK
jgi:transcriptional regulator with XRE-family HTH domain